MTWWNTVKRHLYISQCSIQETFNLEQFIINIQCWCHSPNIVPIHMSTVLRVKEKIRKWNHCSFSLSSLNNAQKAPYVNAIPALRTTFPERPPDLTITVVDSLRLFSVLCLSSDNIYNIILQTNHHHKCFQICAACSYKMGARYPWSRQEQII